MITPLIPPPLVAIWLMMHSVGKKKSKADRLVQWCHGATGFVPLFAMAADLFHEPEYLDAARRGAEAIWERGLLKKVRRLCPRGSPESGRTSMDGREWNNPNKASHPRQLPAAPPPFFPLY